MRRPGPGSKQESRIDHKDTQEHWAREAKQLLERLQDHLRRTIEELGNAGFPLDGDGRMNPTDFSSKTPPVIPEEEIKADLFGAKKYELKFKHTPIESLAKLMEVATTVAFRTLWLNKRFLAIRTTEYDDYFNNIDEIIFDQNTGMPLAMVDVTINPENKMEDILKKIEVGAQIKYMAHLHQGRVILARGDQGGEEKRLPIFILALKPEEVIKLAEQCEKGHLDEQAKTLERMVLAQFVGQSALYPRMTQMPTMSETLKGKYHQAHDIFQALL